MKFQKLLAVASLAFLAGCMESEVTMNYKLNEPIKVDVYAEGYFSTYDEKDEEQIGTITATYMDYTYSSEGDSLKLKRHFQGEKSRGYLKNYMPSELALRASNVEITAYDQTVASVKGLSKGYDAALERISMRESWKKDLQNPAYKPHLERIEKHRWEMDHMLTGTVPSHGNITQLLKERNRLNFLLIKIDSVVTDGFHNLNKRKCLGYTVYLHERESFPYYIWEQHTYSKIVPEKFKEYKDGITGEYSTAYWITIDPTTGVPCQEREVKDGIFTMVNSAIQDTAKFKAHVTLERLYNIEAEE